MNKIRTDEQEDEFWEYILELYEEAYIFTCRTYGLPNNEEGIGCIVRVHNWDEDQLKAWLTEQWLPSMQNLVILRKEFANE